VFNVQRFSLHDGPGIRTTVFLKGCPLQCAWCHNPEGIAAEPEVLVVENRCIRCGACRTACPLGIAAGGGWIPDGREACTACGTCADVCPTGAREVVGREVTVDELLAEVLRDRVFFDTDGGVTFSGGEPLLQLRFLEAMLEACRAAGLHTAIDTSGLAPLKHLLRVAALADLVLFDVKLMDDTRHRMHTGVSNTQILANLDAVARLHPNIWLRVPIIPGVNDDETNIRATAALAAGFPSVRRVHLLPYHRLGADKRRRLGNGTEGVSPSPPTRSRLDELAAEFTAAGVTTTIGG
jgi:pyruvate formate lyase activating enzyme